jgi:hypothetical protein
MDTDLALTLGMVIGAFAIPALVSSYSDRRAPRISMLMILTAGAMILYALMAKPGGYSFAQLPDVIFGVFARFMP